MSFEIFLQLVLNSIVAGSIYSLLAVSFSVIYVTNRFIHMAHGSVAALCVYILYFLVNLLNVNFVMSSILTFLSAICVGYVVYCFYYKFRQKKASAVSLLLASIALMIFLDSLNLLLFGSGYQSLSIIKVSQGINVLGAFITPVQLIIVGLSFVVLLLFCLVIKKTRLGLHMQALSESSQLLQALGVCPGRVYLYSFIIGCVLAAVSGVLYSLEFHLNALMSTKLVVTSFASVIVSGLNSINGAISGAFVIAFAENFAVWFVPTGYRDSITFLILFLVLVLKPQGFFGNQFSV